MKTKIVESKKLNRKDRIEYIEIAINRISSLRYAGFHDDKEDRSERNVRFISGAKKPFYSWWTIFIDIVIAIIYKK
jgi:hypothetical protein